MNIRYDSKLEQYKSPFGCLRQEETCSIFIDIPKHSDITELLFMIETENGDFYRSVPMVKQTQAEDYITYTCSFSLSECGLYYYYFQAKNQLVTFTIFKDGYSGTTLSGANKWQLTCFHADYETPDAFKGKVMYQIFPDRFYADGVCDTTGKLEPFFIHENKSDTPIYYPDQHGIVQNNDFYGGNLRGVLKKLSYLHALHVEILYFNPLFMAYSNHRYDTADYKRIDPLLGTEEDFRLLCERAHQYGMKIILDGVFSHTGCNSLYFDKYGIFGNGAYHHEDSPYRSWYQFDSSKYGGYASWWGIDTLPCTEELDESFLDFIIRDKDSVIAYWLNLGADGYRLDVADELPDQFIAMIHARMKEIKPNSLLIGEVWEDASNKIAYSVRRRYFVDSELDSIMNYPYKDAIIAFVRGDMTAESFAHAIMTIAEHYPKPVLDCLMNILGTHDTMRILTVLGTDNFALSRSDKAHISLSAEQYALAVERLKIAAFLQFMLPGCPCIYYGDEVGTQGFEDPFNRRYFPWESMDPTLLKFYQILTGIKATHPALQTGTIRILESDSNVLIFERTCEEERLLVFVSLRDRFSCFSNYPVLAAEHAEVENGCIALKKNGFVLLNASE